MTNKLIIIISLVLCLTMLFSVVSCVNKNAETEENEEATTEDNIIENLSEEMQTLIREFENFIDAFVLVVNRMKAGDATVLSQIADFQTMYINYITQIAHLSETELTEEVLAIFDAIGKKAEEALAD